MIRRLFLSVCLLATLPVMSQSEVGKFSVYPRVGVALANMSAMSLQYTLGDGGGELDSKYSPGLAAGIEAEYRATERLGVSFGAIYTQLGCRYPDFSQDYDVPDDSHIMGVSKLRMQLHYVSVPVLLNGYLADGLAVKAGVQLSYLIDANMRQEQTDITMEIGEGGTPVYKSGETVSKRQGIKGGMDKVDVSIPIGISYEYMNVVIDARYNYGLLKTLKNSDGGKARNRYFTFTLGYKFAL